MAWAILPRVWRSACRTVLFGENPGASGPGEGSSGWTEPMEGSEGRSPSGRCSGFSRSCPVASMRRCSWARSGTLSSGRTRARPPCSVSAFSTTAIPRSTTGETSSSAWGSPWNTQWRAKATPTREACGASTTWPPWASSSPRASRNSTPTPRGCGCPLSCWAWPGLGFCFCRCRRSSPSEGAAGPPGSPVMACFSVSRLRSFFTCGRSVTTRPLSRVWPALFGSRCVARPGVGREAPDGRGGWGEPCWFCSIFFIQPPWPPDSGFASSGLSGRAGRRARGSPVLAGPARFGFLWRPSAAWLWASPGPSEFPRFRGSLPNAGVLAPNSTARTWFCSPSISCVTSCSVRFCWPRQFFLLAVARGVNRRRD